MQAREPYLNVEETPDWQQGSNINISSLMFNTSLVNHVAPTQELNISTVSHGSAVVELFFFLAFAGENLMCWIIKSE